MPGDGRRFLFVSVRTTVGFGDQMRWFYDQLLISRLLNRTLVLPDMHWMRQHYDALAEGDSSGLAEVREEWHAAAAPLSLNDFSNPSPQAAKKGANTARSWREKACGERSGCRTRHRYVAPEEMFDMEAMGDRRVATFSEWEEATGGYVDNLLVPGDRRFTSNNCDPVWHSACSGMADDFNLGPRSFVKKGRTVKASAVTCATSLNLQLNEAQGFDVDKSAHAKRWVGGDLKDAFVCSKMEAIKTILDRPEFSAVRTLGLDGWCPASSLLAICEMVSKVKNKQLCYGSANQREETTAMIRASFRLSTWSTKALVSRSDCCVSSQ